MQGVEDIGNELTTKTGYEWGGQVVDSHGPGSMSNQGGVGPNGTGSTGVPDSQGGYKMSMSGKLHG